MCANKQLSGIDFAGAHFAFRLFSQDDTFKWAGELCSWMVSLLWSFSNLFSAPLRTLRSELFPFFSATKNCIIMHFFQKSVLNMHYNALLNVLTLPPTLYFR